MGKIKNVPNHQPEWIVYDLMRFPFRQSQMDPNLSWSLDGVDITLW